MQILTESRYRELLPGFSKPVMSVKTSVADPDPFDTNLHPAFHFDMDLAFQFDADPDLTV
jgi:hypothetical protein